MYGEEAEAHAAELAHHYTEAEAIIGPDKMIRYSLLAGERALVTYANEDALVHFERGLGAKGISLQDAKPAVDGQSAELLFGLGRAQVATLQAYEVGLAVESLKRAFDYYVEAGDLDRAVAVAESIPRPGVGFRTGAAGLIVRALTLVPPDSHEEGRLLSPYVRVMGLEEGVYDDAQEAFRRALAIAQREGDVSLELRTLANAANVDYFHLRFQEALEKSLRAIELARRADDPRAEVSAHYIAAMAMGTMGELEEARHHGASMLAGAERLRDRFWLTTAFWRNGLTSHRQGNLQAALDFNDRGLAVAPHDVRLLGERVLLEYDLGNFDQGEAYLGQVLMRNRLSVPGPTYEYTSIAILIPSVARITGTGQGLNTAEATAEIVLSSPSGTPGFTMGARVGLALLAVFRGDQTAAGEQYTVLGSMRGTALAITAVATDRVLGLLAQTMGNMDQAATHFEDALAFCRKAGYRPELAWTCCDYADALLQRNNEGDHSSAITLLDESLAISSELGMRPLMERVQSRQDVLTA